MLDFWVDSAIISKCTENRCFPSTQRTGARTAKTAKTLDSPGLGRLPVLSLSAYATISGRSLLRAFSEGRFDEGLRAYAQRGYVHWFGSLDGSREALVAQ